MQNLDPKGLNTKAHVEETVAKLVSVENLPNLKLEKRLLNCFKATRVARGNQKLTIRLIGRCYRCKTIVEPFLSPQWFVQIQPLAQPAIDAVEKGHIRIFPEGWVNNYLGWMKKH